MAIKKQSGGWAGALRKYEAAPEPADNPVKKQKSSGGWAGALAKYEQDEAYNNAVNSAAYRSRKREEAMITPYHSTNTGPIRQYESPAQSRIMDAAIQMTIDQASRQIPKRDPYSLEPNNAERNLMNTALRMTAEDAAMRPGQRDARTMTDLQRAGATIGKTFTGTEKQWIGNQMAGIDALTSNLGGASTMTAKAQEEYWTPEREKTKEAAWNYANAIADGTDDLRISNARKALEDAIGNDWYLADEYNDSLLDYEDVGSQVAKQLESAASKIAKGDTSITADNILDQIRGGNLQESVEKAFENDNSFRESYENLINAGAEDLQYAKDVNHFGEFGDWMVDAASSTISSGQSALVSRILLAGPLNELSALQSGIIGKLEAAGASKLALNGVGFLGDRLRDILGMTSFGVGAYGGYTNEARQAILDQGLEIGLEEAKNIRKYANRKTNIELATEMLFSSVGAIRNASGNSIFPGFSDAFGDWFSSWSGTARGSAVLKTLGEKLGGGIEEGLEEVIGDALSDFLSVNRLIGNDEKTTIAEYAKDFAVGFMSGLMGEVTSPAYNALNRQQVGNKVLSGEAGVTYDQLYSIAKSMAEENPADSMTRLLTDTYNENTPLIDAYNKVESNGKGATAQNAGLLYEAYQNVLENQERGEAAANKALAKAVDGKTLTKADLNRMLQSETARDTITDAIGAEIIGESTSEQRDSLKTALEALASDFKAGDAARYENMLQTIQNAANGEFEAPALERTPANDQFVQQAAQNAQWQAPITQASPLARTDVFGRNLQQQALETAAANQYNEQMQNISMVRNAVSNLNLGENGMTAIAVNYDGRQDPTAYVEGMDEAYEMGRVGAEFRPETLKSTAVSPAMQRAAYMAGRDDYQGARYGEEVRLRTGSERNDGQSAVRQTGVLEGNARQNQSWQAGSVAGEVRNAKVSSQSISADTIAKTGLKIISESTDPDVTAAREYAKAHGVNFVAWYGGSLWIDGVQSRGYYDPATNTVYVRAGHKLFTAEQIAKHETTHAMIHEGMITIGDVDGKEQDVSLRTVRDAIIDRIGPDKFSELVDKYVEAYAGTGVSKQGVFEELVCDAMASMNEFAAQGHMEEAIRQQASMDAAKAATEENAANGTRAGPTESGGKHSADNGIPTVLVKPNATLAKRLDGANRTERYKILYEYLRENYVGQVFHMSDGIDAVMDNGDANKVKLNANDNRAAVIGDLRDVVESAKPFAKADNVKNPKFSAFRYYAVNAKIGEYTEPLNVNIGFTRNDKSWHLYDFTRLSDAQKALAQSAGAVGVSGLAVQAHSTADEAKASANNVADDKDVVKQKISSAGTSLNQVPALHKDSRIKWGATNIDIGAGAYEAATEYLKDKGVKNLKWDPYNQPESVNRSTLQYLQDGNKADTATCANVLNVIAEKDARLNVILQAAKSIKGDGKAYFSVYEGDGSGVGRETTKGWQNNLRTKEYADEIRTYFDNVQVKGKLIEASNPKANIPKASWEVKPGTATKFSLDLPVERTDRLIALHNMSEDAIRGMLELGGLAMPSVAITRADMGHNTYGDISVVYGRDSVSPTNRKNVIYSGDAWTPTFPEVGIKINAQKANAADNRVRNLLGGEAKDFGLALDTDNLRDQIQRWGSFTEAYKKGDAFRLAFLRDTGRTITVPTRPVTFSRVVDNQALAKVVKTIDLEDANVHPMKYKEEVKEILRDYYNRKYGNELGEKLYGRKEDISFSDVENVIRGASRYKYNRNAKEVDKARLEKRLNNAMQTKKIQAEYEAWMDELGKGLIEKRGVRNNTDYFTPYGNRRSFEQLYYPYTLANIVKAMEGQAKQGKTSVLTGAGNIRGAAARRYASVEDARRDIGRLKKYDAAEGIDAAIKAFDDHTLDLCNRMVEGKGHGSFTGAFDAAEVLTEVIPKYQTADMIFRYLKREGYDDYYNVTPEIAKEIEDVIKEARALPTQYFEGKMYRAVPITEALAYVVPDNMNKEIKQGLIDAGANVVTYKHGDNEDRLKKVNSVEGARFSRDIDSYLQEQYSEYRTDKENLKLAEEGIRKLEEGSRRISDAEGVSAPEGDGKVRNRDGRLGGSDIRTIGRGITEQFIQKGHVNLNGNKVSSAEDVARLCQIFRNPQFETARYLYVRNGEIVGMDALSSRLPGLSIALAKDFNQHDLVNKLTRVKADGFYMLHNHPSGEVTPSGIDIRTTRTTAKGIEPLMGIKMLGHVVIDHEVYSVIDSSGNVERHELSGQKSFDWLTVPEIDNEHIGKRISDTSDVAAIAKAVRDEDMSVVIYANAQGKVVQIQEISDKTMTNNSQIANYIRNQIRDNGGQMTFLYTKNRNVYDKMAPEYVNGTFLDVVLDNEKIYTSTHRTMKQNPEMYLGKDVRNLPQYVNETSEKYSRDLTNTELLNQNRQLQKDLTELRKQLKTRTQQKEYWKGQTRVTQGRQLRTEDVTRLAREILKDQNSDADLAEVTKKLKALGEYILNVTEEQAETFYEDTRQKAYEIAHDILAGAKILNERGGEHFYKDFRDRLKSSPIYVAPSVRSDVAGDRWNDFRKSLFGTVTLTADNTKGKTVDVVYHDLQAEFGEWLFPEDLITEAEQLEQILEVVETYKPIYENISSYDMADAVEWTANDILTRIIGNEIRETNPTYADKMEKKLADQKLKTQEALRKVREQRDRKVENLKEHYQEVAQARRDRKNDSEMRKRLLKIARRLKSKKVDRASRALLDQYIGDLDLVAISITGKTIRDLEGEQALYDKWVAQQKEELGEDFVPDSVEEEKLRRLTRKRIGDMTQEEVLELTEQLLSLQYLIDTQNKFIDSEVRRDNYAAATEFHDHYMHSKARSDAKFLRNFEADALSPERMMHRLADYNDNDPVYQLGKELSAGARKMLDYQRRANALFEKWLNNKKFIDSIAGKKAKLITVEAIVNGEKKKIQITPAMRMSLYLHAKNDQNLLHIERGGVMTPNMTDYKKGQMGNAYKEGFGTKAIFDRFMIHKITQEMSAEEKAFADMAYWYFNNMSKDAINEVSEQHKGYPIAEVLNYFPIHTSDDYRKADFGQMKQDGSVTGQGFLESRQKGAANPIMLYDMNEVLTRAIEGHSKYYGLAIPVRNMNKALNVIFLGQNGSIRNSMLEEHVKYIDNMLKHVQNGAPSSNGLFASLRSNYAGSVLTLNPAVAAKQTPSYLAAAAVIGAKPLRKALGVSNKKVDLDLVAKYTPLLWYRMRGYSNVELGDINKRGGVASKLTGVKQLNWIQGMDVFTTTKLWTAAEFYVKDTNKDLKPGTDAFYKEVGRIYNRIIEETQPNYTVMQRPGILRSDSELKRITNLFKTQPFQNFNVLYDSLGNLRTKARQYKASGTDESKQALQEARKTFARAVASQAASAIMFSVIQFFADVVFGKTKKYKDDDDKMTFWSVNRALLLNMLSSAFGMVPFGGTILEGIESLADRIATDLGGEAIFGQKFYGLSENSLEAINDFEKNLESLISDIIRTIKGTKSWESNTRNLVQDVSMLLQPTTGLPAPNIVKDLRAIILNTGRVMSRANAGWNTPGGKIMAEYAALRVTTDPSKYKSDYYNVLYKAYRTDKDAYEEIRQNMLDAPGNPFATQDKTAEENIDKQMADRNKKYLEVQAFYEETYNAVTSSDIWNTASTDQKATTLKTLETIANNMDFKSKSGEAIQEKLDETGTSATAYLLYNMAISMVDQPEGVKGHGSYDEGEITKAIEMTNLSDKEKASLWNLSDANPIKNPYVPNEMRDAVQGSPLWAKATQEQRDSVMTKWYNLEAQNENGKTLREKLSAGKKVGLTETEYLLYSLALSMVDQPEGTKGHGGYDMDEITKALNMVTGLTKAEKSFLWTFSGKSEKNNPYK